MREQEGEPGSADLHEARLAELGVVVVEDDVRDAIVHRGSHVVGRHVEEARQVEEPRTAEVVDLESIAEVARDAAGRGLGIGQQRRQQEDDEAHPEERRDRPYSAPQGEGEHDDPTIQIVCPC